MSDPVVSCVGWSVVAVSLLIIRVATAAGEDDTDTPTSFLQGSQMQGSSPIVCVGDSLTRGNLSADWVGVLREQLTKPFGQQYKHDPAVVLNAGVNMHCSKNIQARLCEITACRPSHVTVLVGTNDLKAELSPVEGFLYRFFGKLPEVPSLESYEQTLREIRETLVATGAQVALVSPPVLGEVLNSKANQRAAQFAHAVRRVAEEGGERCAYLPLFERTAAALPTQGGKDYCGLQFFALLCTLCVDMHLLQRDLADIQRERDLGVTVDLVHLGPSAASMLADMVADFVRSAKATASVPCMVAP
jgi:lysophospholipase L1-like esterase